MREIKFRAFLNSKYYEKPCMLSWEELLERYNATDMFQKDLMTLMQYTGLKDKNGREIYEGDIVHGYDQEPDRYDGYNGINMTDVVNFKYGAFWIGDSWYKVMVMTPPIVEVIGNIHTSPELLEDK